MNGKADDETRQLGTCHADRVDEAADRLYCAECALHAAFESHIDTWISAAYERLHEAIAEHTDAVATGVA